jgi:hypothetical protein
MPPPFEADVTITIEVFRAMTTLPFNPKNIAHLRPVYVFDRAERRSWK